MAKLTENQEEQLNKIESLLSTISKGIFLLKEKSDDQDVLNQTSFLTSSLSARVQNLYTELSSKPYHNTNLYPIFQDALNPFV